MQAKEPKVYNLTIQDAVESLSSSRSGLSKHEAATRLVTYGKNELTAKKPPLWKRIVEPFLSYFVVIILGAAVLSAVEKKWFEALIISAIVLINALIFYFQQFSVGRVLKALKAHDKQKITVFRDNKTVLVLSTELVPGDVIKVSEGIKVPADGRIIDSNHIQCDESVLTGESLPVHKHADVIDGTKQIYDQENMLFKGTYIRGGTGLLLVTNTGNNTQFGAINTLASTADNGKTPIEQKIDDLTKKLLIAISIACVLVFTLAVYRGIQLEEALRFTISLAVSAVPEGLPVAMSLVLLFSARRMAKQKALVKKISAMETLGAVTLIATDKTGTITKNKLSVVDTYSPHQNIHAFHLAVRDSLNGEEGDAEDPLDQILHHTIAHVNTQKTYKKVREFPFNQQLRLSGVLWKTTTGYLLHVKGAPEQILAHLGSSSDNVAAQKELKVFTKNGYRTIGFGHKNLGAEISSLSPEALRSLTLDGFVALSDQIRDNVHQAIDEAHLAGIKVVMLTGDHVETAGYIAKHVGIARNDDEVSTSDVLEKGSANQIRTAMLTIRAFGRVLPEHKFALLKAVKGHEITAMTGDGVNDIPALVEANVGFAMGSGTDAAKDASDVVLMDSNFRTIMTAIKSGRTVLANIRKMVVYLLGTSGGEVLTMLIALVAGVPLPLTAVMLLWVNLVTDGVSVIPLGLSPSESHHMK